MYLSVLSYELELPGHLAATNQPGPTETDITSALAEILKPLVPLGRLGRPEEIAGLVADLANPKAGFLTGSSQLISRSRTLVGTISSCDELESASAELLKALFPLEKVVRLLGVTISRFSIAIGRSERIAFVPILLQKSQMTQRPFSRRKTKQATIAGRWRLKPDTRVAHAFRALRRGHPRRYSIVAPTARRI
jgi:hypothetical protein